MLEIEAYEWVFPNAGEVKTVLFTFFFFKTKFLSVSLVILELLL